MQPQVPRSAFCNVKGCGQPAAFFPVIKVWAKGHPKTSTPLKIEVGMAFCHQHKDEFKLPDIPGLERVTRAACASLKKAEPDFSNAELEIVPIT